MRKLPFKLNVLALIAAVGVSVLGFGQSAAQAEGEVNLYSYRQPFLIEPLTTAFTEQTGIKVNMVYAKKGMLERLKAEGMNSPADVVLTVDIGRLHDMVEADVLQPVDSEILNAKVPAQFRHPDGLWYGLTLRGRVFMVSKERMGDVTALSYEDLAKPEMKGKICIRSGKNIYNVSLIASMIAHDGEAATEEWLKGLKANLARKPQGNDRAQAAAVYAGECDLAIANTYYLGAMATNDKKPEQKKHAEAVKIIFPNQDGRGTHMNISGAAITKSSKNTIEAVKFLEFLASEKAQEIYAKENFEYPVKPGIELDPMVASWGKFKQDDIPLDEVAKNRAAASKLVDKVRFNDGPTS